MKKSRFTDKPNHQYLKANEAGAKVADLCREHGMSQALFYKWHSKYDGMDVSLMKRLKERGRERPFEENVCRKAFESRACP